MGKLKDIIESNDCKIADYLLEKGFEYNKYVYGNNYGYQRLFDNIDNGLYNVYVHCDLKNEKLNIYKEYDYGDYADSYECNIPKDLIKNDNINDFIDWLDDKCEKYL